MPILLLIRHGDNDVFKTRIAGRLPGVHLNADGLRQAQTLAQNLASAPLAAVYSSPLERALETAAPLAAFHSLQVTIHPGLVEVDYGQLQGRTYKQLQRMKLWKLVHDQPAAVQFPGGESLTGVQRRAVSALSELATCHEPKQVIACVTHGDVIRLAVAHFMNIPLDDYQIFTIATASITALELGSSRVRFLHINQVDSLDWPRI